jgi:serine/threonine-protein kinase
MIDGQGVVRLLDFGIAKGDPTKPGPDLTLDRITASNQVVGSPEYMSPEQIHGLPLDRRTDVYSFGIVLYELFTGRVPFRGPSAFDTMLMHVREPPPLEGDLAATIPPVVLPILTRALGKAPEDRQGSMRELIRELKRARSIVAGIDPHTYSDQAMAPRPWWRRVEVWMVLGAFVSGLLILFRLSQ